MPEMTAWASQSTGAEKQNRKSSGSVMDASDAVKASGSSWAAVFLRFSRRAQKMNAEGLGEAGVHPDDALREGQAEVIFSHHDHIGPDVGDAVRRQLPAQS